MDCPNCGVEILSPANYEAWEVITLADPVMWGPGGTVHQGAIEAAMDMAGIEDSDRRNIYEKILVWIDLVREDLRDRQK